VDLKKLLVEAIEVAVGEAGKRQDHIADEYGVSRTDVSLVRRGKAYATFSTDKAISIAAAFGVGFDAQLVKVDREPHSSMKAVTGPVVFEDIKF
jgi:predicted XRE-type DNA-binding protein